MYGDLDGVVVIPRELVVEVLDKTETLIRHEDQVREEFNSGADPVAVYKRHGRL
jgi:regulator of RNase E activity RraA